MNSTPRPSRKTIRLQGYDYRSPGYYHIVIVTADRKNLLGSFESGKLVVSEYGKVIEELLSDFSDYNPGVEIIKHQIMPDHIHLLVQLFEGEKFEDPPAISSVVSKIKTLSLWKYNKGAEAIDHPPLPKVVWQRSYFDHILRTDEEASYTFDYVEFNPDQETA